MNTLAVALALLLAFGGCGCLYLASPHQRWRSSPLPARPARTAGFALLSASLVAFARAMQLVPAIFTFGAAVMLLLVVLPYVGAARMIVRRGR